MVATQLSGIERLTALDLSVEVIANVLRRADAEADTCSELDPPIMQGLLRWGRANRYLREELIPLGWSHDNPRNLARTIHPSGDLAIVIATGDDGTGVADYDAGPRHSKGYATEQAIHANGQLAFEFGALVHASQQGVTAGVALRTWLLLFHAEREVFRVELSLPEAFDAGRITRWTERILLPPIERHRDDRNLLSLPDLQCLTGDTVIGMTRVSVRDLRNHGGEVLDRVARGESVTVTRDGTEVAEIRPLPRRGPSAAELIERRRRLPPVDPERLRRELDSTLDPSL